MSNALFLYRLAGPLPQGYGRLYFGSEFCAWAFPSQEEIVRAVQAVREAGWAFTLALPVMPETFLMRLPSILKGISALLRAGDEIMISDLGQIRPAREALPDFPLILGRALSGQKRGPQILELSLTEDQLAYFRQGSCYSTENVAFLHEQGIARIELDNLLQGVAPLPAGLSGSLHYPFAMVTSSRNCPHRSPETGRCSASCNEVFVLTAPGGSPPLFQAGNTQFLRNDELPPDLSALNIDRLVFHPDLPR